MTFLEAAALVLNAGWSALQISFPGTSISIGFILIGALCAVVSLRVIGYVINVRYNIGSTHVSKSSGGK